MTLRNIPWIVSRFFYLVFNGGYKNILHACFFLVYLGYARIAFWIRVHFRIHAIVQSPVLIQVATKYPVAFTSPDYIVLWGTKNDNSTNGKFVLLLDQIVQLHKFEKRKGFLDLGCAGGQLVKDFHDLGWLSVGLEGSDYSRNHNRANWVEMSNKNLFTCDIAKPFQIRADGTLHKFHLITAWEVLEHIKRTDLPVLFSNIMKHLARGGYFIASTTSISDIHQGLDLHQTRMSNRDWRKWIAMYEKKLQPVDLGLSNYHYVRYNAEGSYLVYQATE